MTLRNVRNNNPGNLDAGQPWFGLMPPESMTVEQRAEKRFAVFQSARYGFRALAIDLLNYQRKHGLNTVREIIGRWAPPSENNTAGYIKFVCDAIGKEPDAPLDLRDPAILRGLAKAIATRESAGAWCFQTADLDAGVSLALRTGRPENTVSVGMVFRPWCGQEHVGRAHRQWRRRNGRSP